jgi:hypothetical protein
VPYPPAPLEADFLGTDGTDTRDHAGVHNEVAQAVNDIVDQLDTTILDVAAHLADTVDAHDATAISYAGNAGLSATTVEAALDELDDEKAPLNQVFNTQTGSYTLVLADNGKVVEMNVAGANNLTVPLNSSVAFPTGTRIDIAQYGAGQTTVVATGGVNVRSKGGALKLSAQYAGATLLKRATDEWYLFGEITT